MSIKSNENDTQPNKEGVVVVETSQIEAVQEVKPDLLASVLADDSTESPEVQHHAVQAFKDKAERNAPQEVNQDNTTHINNDTFDPNLHRVDKDGNPVKTITGKFRKKTKSSLNNPNKDRKVTEAVAVQNNDIHKESEMSADMIQTLKFGLYEKILDFKANETQVATSKLCTTNYLVSMGGVKISPLALLAFVEGQQLIEAMGTPKGATVRTSIKQKLASWYVGFKDKRKDKKNGTSDVSGTKSVGENKPSDSSST